MQSTQQGIKAVNKVGAVFSNIWNDIKSFNPSNTDEKVVLDANCFSIYKGHFVIRQGGTAHRSFSMGVMFIDKAETAKNPESIKTVQHEYGHTVQFKKLGLARYIAHIAIPSMNSTVAVEEYYDQLWEVSADAYGGVDRKHDLETYQAGFDYLAESVHRRRPACCDNHLTPSSLD